ncbi:Endonuclease/exonuclease/phosphatase-like protein [Pleurostoma richardsiae]|uniref:Endonuclease/exonuclease/phosphatase-like protein n=1 Tax=Pleurostoma richardsiae TaxID=41990 RepID=A0AA38RBZ7_9PEZI|nr:Endonuclease/exonuclease/phosphatase-like protein [Pleurostoma richardsiae]
MRFAGPWAVIATLQTAVAAVTIAEINGDKFLSPYSGQTLSNITGVVTAKGSSGIWIRSTTPDDDVRTSESIYVYSSSVGTNLTVGDLISLDAKVSEYRSSSSYLYLTELGSPKNVKILSSGNTVTPLIIGQDTLAPPTVQYTSLDGGDIYALPNAVANISAVNPVLDPTSYGLDFWESLSGELVTVRSPRVIGRPNSYRETWVVGDWPVTGQSAHGSLTMSDKDSNPETVIVGSPLDGTRNPTQSKIGDLVEDITGVIYQSYGFYYILPLTALKTTVNATAAYPPTSLTSQRNCRAITVGDYNVENMAPTSAHVPKVAAHIATHLGAPDLMFVQEIQDNSGPTDNGVVSANATLAALTAAIKAAGNVTYEWVEIDPVDGEDGGQPGGNIRVAYLYRPEVLSLWKPNPGSSTDANEVLPGPELKFNPGRIDPANEAWEATRKPLAAAWLAKGAKKPFFTINVHMSSKGGSSSLEGDARPPINGVVANRLKQANVTGAFISQILAEDSSARVITSGDFNEFTFVEPMEVFASTSGLRDLDEVVGMASEERYTYTYDMNTQALDHMYVSPALEGKAQYEHVHVNSWAAPADVVSDHDPSVALLNVCGCA